MDEQTSKYRRAEIDKVQATEEGFPRKLKIIAGDGGGTKWLDITDIEMAIIERLLVRGKEKLAEDAILKNDRERKLEAQAELSAKYEEQWRTHCEKYARKIDELRAEIDNLENINTELERRIETLVGVK